MWRHQNGREAREIDLRPGVALTIPVGTSFQFRDTGREPLAAVGVTMPPWPGEGEAIDTNGPWTPKYSPQGVVEAVLARAGLLMLRSSPVERATPGWVRDPSRNGEHRDGLPSTFPPPDAEPRGTGRSGQGRRAAAEADGEPFAHVTGDGRGQVGAGRDPRGGGSATCKIAGIACLLRFESCPCHTTSKLGKRGRRVADQARLRGPGFPPVSLRPTPRRHRRPHLGVPRRRAEHGRCCVAGRRSGGETPVMRSAHHPRRGHYELAVEEPANRRVAVAVDELTGVI